jgi:hypothetical protein
MPRAGARYRCHVCRLELVMDLATGRLMVPAIEAEPLRETAPDARRRHCSK